MPIIGCGGIVSANDALEFIMAGASAIQVGTATFSNPQTLLSILEGIAQFMEKEGLSHLDKIIGVANIS